MAQGKPDRPPLKPGPDGIVRLAGGNPQIAKGYGDEVVQRYISAMLGWQSGVGKHLDALIERTIPGVQKAVKWNSALYGTAPNMYFVSFSCLTKYVKVAFLEGALLDPVPPGASKTAKVRYLDIYETDTLDEAQFADWLRQASLLPGEKM